MTLPYQVQIIRTQYSLNAVAISVDQHVDSNRMVALGRTSTLCVVILNEHVRRRASREEPMSAFENLRFRTLHTARGIRNVNQIEVGLKIAEIDICVGAA